MMIWWRRLNHLRLFPTCTQVSMCFTEAPMKFALGVEMLMETAANYSNHGQHEKVGAFDCFKHGIGWLTRCCPDWGNS